MADSSEKNGKERFTGAFTGSVGRKAVRKLRARRERGESVWFWLGMFGLVGWSVALPTLLGVALGVWMDRKWPGDISWTLTFLLAGVFLGCWNAWRWIQQERERR